MILLAIDPGTTESGWVILDDDDKIAEAGIQPNSDMLKLIQRFPGPMAVEMIASYGMAVGKEVFETCVWIGKYLQAHSDTPWPELLIYRRDVKLHLCNDSRAKDANIRRALLDLFGPQGTKAKPGPTYGVKSHAWAALGVAATVRGITPKGET